MRSDAFTMILFKHEALTGQSTNIRRQKCVLIIISFPHAACICNEDEMFSTKARRGQKQGAGRVSSIAEEASAVHQKDKSTGSWCYARFSSVRKISAKPSE